jgi:hypothetical protein
MLSSRANNGIRLDAPEPVTRLMDEDCPGPSVVQLHFVFQFGRINHAVTDQACPTRTAPDH